MTKIPTLSTPQAHVMGEVRRFWKMWHLPMGVLMLMLSTWLVLLLFPALLNGAPMRYGRFLIYGVAEADARAIQRIVADAEVRLRRYPHPLPERVMVVFSSQARYRTFNPLAWKAYAATNSGGQIWFNQVDFRRDRFDFSSSDPTDRTIDGVLAHEVTHVALRQNYGQSILLTVPRWIREGYCETIARETSMPFQSGSAQVRQASTDSSSRYFYFKSYIAVRGLHEVSHVPLDMLMKSPQVHQMQLDDLASRYISDVADSSPAH
jgi:hypothetical protein